MGHGATSECINKYLDHFFLNALKTKENCYLGYVETREAPPFLLMKVLFKVSIDDMKVNAVDIGIDIYMELKWLYTEKRIIHNDTRRPNIMKKFGEDGAPSYVLIDFAFARQGRGGDGDLLDTAMKFFFGIFGIDPTDQKVRDLF